LKSAHLLEYLFGRFQCLGKHAKTSQDCGKAAGQLGIIVYYQYPEGLALLQAEAALQSILQAGQVNRMGKEALGAGSHGVQLRSKAVLIG
jgi:hypothetical protein